MTTRRLTYAFLIGCAPLPVAAQMSGYASVGYGPCSNPLHNYERLSDQLTEGYLELQYLGEGERSTLGVGYVGALMVFNQLQERNSYEHTLSFRYTTHMGRSDGKVDLPPESEETSDSSTSSTESPPDDDSTGTTLVFGLTGSARHDKPAFQEFDNYGAGVNAGYQWRSESGFAISAQNETRYRDYLHLRELTNVTDALRLAISHSPDRVWTYGLALGGGIKHYTVSAYDTSLFEPTRTFVTKPSGKGKGGAPLLVPSTKRILANPESNASATISADVNARAAWLSGSAAITLSYRHNPGPPNRYIAQYTNTSLLNQDIYDDEFSYGGPELSLAFIQKFPLSLSLQLNVLAGRREYGLPALTLAGESQGRNRRDGRGDMTVTISRYTEVGSAIGYDIGIEVHLIRNQSNDEYHDFSASSILLQLGISY